ncbi:expressed unknown protein [Seminavis robusta]|uniref:Uncharacterized protein n=1 Tax=Seminavis robusta TaxID=568900 RepID=A0A9N8HQJ7_9STRA|nr:expressed unknown protein [Seminavis robusta]|eukprot:Sro1171_g248890.1 n/a (116) ;mRNA; r:25206-25553
MEQQRLGKDYLAITSLLAELQQQSTKFNTKIKRLRDATVPACDGLETTWQEQTQITQMEQQHKIHNTNQKRRTRDSSSREEPQSRAKRPRNFFTLDTKGILDNAAEVANEATDSN